MLIQLAEKEFLDSIDIRHISNSKGFIHEDGFISRNTYGDYVAHETLKHGPRRQIEITRITLKDKSLYFSFMPVNAFMDLLKASGIPVQGALRSSFY